MHRNADKIKQTKACLKGPMTLLEEPGAPVSVAVTLRRIFNLYVKVRPCQSFPSVESLKPNIDLIVVRENTRRIVFRCRIPACPRSGNGTEI